MVKNPIPRYLIEKVKANNKILSLVEADMGKLKPKGDKFCGHHIKHSSISKESLVVDPKNNFYYCFNCSEGGDPITWLIYNRGMSFVETVKYLAIRAGITIPELDSEELQEYEKWLKERIKIEQVNNATAQIYQCLLTEGHYEWIYNKWGIKRETVDSLMIGYAPAKGNYLYWELIDKGFDPALLRKTGLFNEGSDSLYDIFQGRIIFPYWKNGSVVSFIGRETEQTPEYEKAKYRKLTTHSDKHPYVSETVENSYFYGEDTIRGKDYFIITEGITDAIMADQAGIPCISPVTVRFRKKDYPKLLKLAKQINKVYIANDNEESKAGEKGAWATAEYLMSKGIRVRLIKLPRPEDIEKIDLAEYLKKHSKDDFKELIKKAKSP
ncbi:MAG: CHC2 zinc finger domain-containing protein, partial [bacterium]